MQFEQDFVATNVDGASEEILNQVQRNSDNKIIYFYGWSGFGTAAVLKSIYQLVSSTKYPPSERCFDRTIYIDCSKWKSKREMQRKIADELKLDHKIMAMLDKQDEEDDFNGVDHGSRDVIRNVAGMIDRALRDSKFMVIFLNGSDEEIVLSRFGIPEYRDYIIIWTFKRRFMAMSTRYKKIADKLRYTDLFLFDRYGHFQLSRQQFSALFWEEATNIVACHPCIRDINLTMVIDCCLYGLFLYCSLHNTTRSGWAAHAPNFWIYDGIIQGDRAREISNALHHEISFECDDSLLDTVCGNITLDSETPFLVRRSDNEFSLLYVERSYRWISINSKNSKSGVISKKEMHEHMLKIVPCASSIFLSSERTESPLILQNALFEQCKNLGVLVLSYCAFSFVSPPFLCCQMLKFLGLDHCTDSKDTKLEGQGCTAEWACLHSLSVLDNRSTDWDEILSEEKMGLMANLAELNIEGVRCWQYISQLQKRLPNLERLRITKPVCQAEFSKDISNSFMDKTKLELLDLSGNSEMRNLPTSLSMASNLQVLILDGCDQLENVVLPDGLPSLRSFSFDGCGPAPNWRSSTDLPSESSRPKCPSDADKKDVKTTMIYLQGCTLLENLFLRGLRNLVELDLSGSAIKILDFKNMVVDVPSLKRLFLMGCEHLRAIIWGSGGSMKQPELELLCVDTRPGSAHGCMARPSLGQHKSFQLQVHAIIRDARLARSLWVTIWNRDPYSSYYNINITSSGTLCGEVLQIKTTTSNKMTEPSCTPCDHQRYRVLAADLYGDAYWKVGDGPTPMQAFPLPPTPQLDRHIEIGNGSCNVQSEVEDVKYEGYSLAGLMTQYTQSLHVHDVSTCSNTMAKGAWNDLKWCRVERCSNLDAVFPPGADEGDMLETIWASDLSKARCIWSQGLHEPWCFQSLRQLYLCSCPSLRFAIPVRRPSFHSLETLHIVHCGDLRHIFVLEKKSQTSVVFPRLTTIHLHDLPALQQICEATKMPVYVPVLETIKIRGCPNLRRLPACGGRKPGMRRPAVEVEKDVWDALEWDGVDAGHHPSLYEAPVHSRYYKRRFLRPVSVACVNTQFPKQI